jgi:hypothetical protein
MSTNRTGYLNADVITTESILEFRVAEGLNYYDLPGVHFIEANNGQGKEFYVYLPMEIGSGSFSLGLGERSPMVIHVTGTSEAELYRGRLELTVGGDAQFTGTFSGLDADSLEVEKGSFRLDYEAS